MHGIKKIGAIGVPYVKKMIGVKYFHRMSVLFFCSIVKKRHNNIIALLKIPKSIVDYSRNVRLKCQLCPNMAFFLNWNFKKSLSEA